MSDETDKLLHHPDVIKIIDRVVGACGLRGHLLDDARQTVFELCLRAKSRPDTLDGWKKLGRKIAKRHGIDELRKRKSWQGTHAGLTDEADEYASPANYRPRWEEHDAEKALKLLWWMIDEGLLPKDFEAYLDAIQAGVPLKQIAVEAGMSEGQFSKQQWRARRQFAAQLTAAGMGALAVAVGIFFVVVPYLDRTHVVHHGGEATAPDAGLAGPGGVRAPLPPQITVDTHKEEVAALRAQIAEAAKGKNWEECLRLYVKLDGIEPADPTDPLKRRCVTGLSSTLFGKSSPDGGKLPPKR